MTSGIDDFKADYMLLNFLQNIKKKKDRNFSKEFWRLTVSWNQNKRIAEQEYRAILYNNIDNWF